LKQTIPICRSAFPDLRFVIEDMIAESDKVAVYWTLTATNLGSFRGMPPTGNRAEAEGMTLVRLRNGKPIEARSCWDTTGLRQQIGTAPLPKA
jgi:predicted ester cyclase